MIPAERQKMLLNLISQQDIVSISQLVETLGVSHMTVRRDIQKLEEEGKVVSVSGGVKMLEHLSIEPTHNDKSLLSPSQKSQIGIKASEIIPEKTTIYLDAGTTTLEIAHHIVDREDLLVITNDFVIANFLMKAGKCELIHTGGSVNKSNYSSVGELAAQFLRQISIDIAFISTSSWNLKGLTTPDENKLPVKRAILQSSNKRILVSDSSKYGKVATFQICPLSEFDVIICDSDLLENAKDAINEMRIELLLV
ncbi:MULTISPECIES: DeoR/GlpR family DNA-binding transcription regulator [Basfia]|uniref:GlpR protein n=2 Tax=Basfia TaxID=697331 RepID=Q65R20_MANSM|nr:MULTISPECIES: DeoR/GlpR family DNA-binding transcription regulator [Basfia]AAU38590.1 GlpR protein [[Mannheimia] succiniciproducens MBEL55E]QIM69188.1 DeoR family transcriptional regulator [Basfia succiniciproducens]SCY08577.1 transcriptional regulator, DeoR family [Basfia succiniciproducens]SEP57388.1 transcriptional regulator, DeoR family [Basfia succiniciproducens]